MLHVLHVAAILIVAVAMSLSLAHALELPGKLRLDRQTYLAVQEIYYPSFAYGGGFSEVLAIVVTMVLLVVTPRGEAFGWTLAALLLLVAMQAVYWIATRPVDTCWTKKKRLKELSKGFFAAHSTHGEINGRPSNDAWRRLRDRWEYSHVLRAILALSALVAIAAVS